MSKKECVKITPEGLNMVMILNYSSIAEMNGFYGKEVFFTESFEGNAQYLFQALGNFGAFVRSKDFDKDINCIVIANKIITKIEEGKEVSFISDLEEKLNQNNSPYKRIKLISEDHLIWYIENRVKNTNDDVTNELMKKYKASKKEKKQDELF